MHTLAVIALKGGSGKTTVATHLAIAACRRGQKVLVADTDPQGSAKDVLSARAQDKLKGKKAGGDLGVLSVTGAQLLSSQFAARGLKRDLLIIDTAAGALEDASEAIVLADYCVLIVRPTMLDLAGLVRTLQLVKKLKKPFCVVMNQAPVPREGSEAPVVRRFLRGLDYMGAQVAPVVMRTRSAYQTALETGRSAEESSDEAAAAEVAALWDYVAGELDEVAALAAEQRQA